MNTKNREIIFAKEGCWLTQSEKNDKRPRIFVKTLPVHYPEMWCNWTDEQYQEYCKEHGEMTTAKLIQYYSNFDYSKEGGFLGTGNLLRTLMSNKK